MKKQITILILALLTGLGGVSKAQLAVQADTLYTMEGPKIIDGVVLVRNGTIEAVGPASEVEIPSGYEVRSTSVANHDRKNTLPDRGRSAGGFRDYRSFYPGIVG